MALNFNKETAEDPKPFDRGAEDMASASDETATAQVSPAPTQDAEWDGKDELCAPEDITEEVKHYPKTLHNSDVSGARINVPDIQVVGDGDTFKLICKASSECEGWMKSTKAMETPHGCIVQVTTQQRGVDGTYAVAEALTYVPGVKLRKGGDTHVLVPR